MSSSVTSRSCAILLVAVVWGCAVPRSEHGSPPPGTRSVGVVDDYHGVEIRDPYRWLEDQDSAEVLEWARAQNEHTESRLARVPSRADWRRRLGELWNFERFGVPRRYGEIWIHSRNDGLQDQDVIRVATEAASAGRVLLDPNLLSPDGTVSLSGFSISRDGARAAVGTSTSGSDWIEWRVLDVATGEWLTDELRWTKFTGAAWTHDGAGFFYRRYPAPVEGEVFEAANRESKLCYHRLGTDQADDAIVYERPDAPQQGFGATVTDDGRFCVVSISEGTDRRNRVAWIDLTEPDWTVRPLLMEFDASYRFVGNRDRRFWFLTDRDAPNGRLVAVDIDRRSPHDWIEVIPECDDKIAAVELFGGEFVAAYLVDASTELRRFSITGEPGGVIDLPGLGTVSALEGAPEDRTFHFAYQSVTEPPSVWAYDLDNGTLVPLHRPECAFDPDRFVTRRVAFQASDGARLAMFLVHRRDMRLDGRNPTYLYGYGGFNIPITPRFSVPTIAWIERGGLYAQATLRGGGEFGEEWHAAGMLENKQRVFDDFAECAEYLIRNDYTSPAHLAIGGRSNGGLLVGATLNQRPELFGAAIPEVGVMDMLRYHEFTIGWAWASEYGRSDDPEMFPVLRAYSPLHNVRTDVAYPPVLVMTGDHDDRVLPGHSYKYAAALQAAQPGSDILLRVQMKSGHGSGKPVRMLIDEAADRWAFLDSTIGR